MNVFETKTMYSVLFIWVLTYVVLGANIAGPLYRINATLQEEIEKEVVTQTEYVEVPTVKVVNFEDTTYSLSDDERTLAERIVACEAGADTLEGQMAVAQCLFDSVMIDDSDLHKVYDKYGYSLYQRAVTEENKLAVSLVFDYGAKVSDKPIQWFVTVAAAPNSWHENHATFDAQYGAHRFYYDSNIIME